mgnify:FL=1
MDKIYTGNDRAKELHLKNHREAIAFACAKSGERWNGRTHTDPAFTLDAFVDFGRWLVICECGNVMYAEPLDPIAFCNQCGNALVPNHDARLVNFPENRVEIEAALLERETSGHPLIKNKMADKHGASQLALMPQFKPVVVSRSWKPGETVEDLRNEHARMKEEKEEREKIKDG